MVCSTLAKEEITSPPTLLVGLVSFFKSGYSNSKVSNSFKYLSNS